MGGAVGDLVGGIGDAAGGIVQSAAPYAGLIGGALGGPMGAMAGSMIGGSLMGSQQKPTYNAQTGQYDYPSIGNAIGGGLGAIGGMLQKQTSKEAIQAAQQQAIQAGQQGAQMAQFRPVGVTTRFGGSQFQVDPATGQLTSAGYNLSPEVKAYQDQLMGLAGQGLTQAQGAQAQYAPLQQGAQGMFNLGQQYLGSQQGQPLTAMGQQYMQSQAGQPLTSLGAKYLAQSPEQVAQDYMKNQLALLQPGREQQSAQTMNQLQQTGRTGLAVAQGGALGAANPEMQALANARSMQDLQLAAQANQAGQQNAAFGASLYGQGTGLTQAQQLAGANLYGQGLGLTQQGQQFGAGLFGTGAQNLGNYYAGQTAALSPYTAAMGAATGLENLGQNAFTLGTGLGTSAATAGANAGRLAAAGGLDAAKYGLSSELQYNPWASALGGLTGPGSTFAQGIGNSIGGWMSGFGGQGAINDAYTGLGGYGADQLSGLI